MTSLVVAVFVLTSAEYFTHGDGPLVTGAASPSAKACATCHTSVHAEWAASRHALAWTNGIFRAEFETRPRDWCVHCHAPLTQQLEAFHRGDAASAEQKALLAEGVGCPSCHVRNGIVHAATVSGKAPHPVVAKADFGSPTFCGGCHEFNFPKFADDQTFVASTAHPMQATVSQHARGPYAGSNCSACHTSPNGHAFPGAHDMRMLESALQLDVCRDHGHLVTKVVNVGAGHNVPTGDVHRHVTLRVWRSSAPEKVFDVYIGRRFSPDPSGGNFTSEDTTLAPRQSRTDRVAIKSLGGSANELVNVELRYVYVVDEFPTKNRAPSEPTFDVIRLERVQVNDVPTCRR